MTSSIAPGLACRFIVGGEPVPAARPRVFVRGKVARAITPARTKNYERLVGAVALAARPEGWRLDWARYSIAIRVHRGHRRGDGDNIAKAIADGLTGVLWSSDAAVTRWSVEIDDVADGTNPRAEVEVQMLGEVDAAADRRARSRSLARARRGSAATSIEPLFRPPLAGVIGAVVPGSARTGPAPVAIHQGARERSKGTP